jgi:hypothetical protein
MFTSRSSKMIASTESKPVEIAAYDGVVIFSGFGRDRVVLAADVAERIGYYLCAAAYAATNDVARTWREDVYGLAEDEDTGKSRAPEEPRSFETPERY